MHQKRVPTGAPPWIETVRLHFPRYGQHADELCVTELAQVHLGGADVDRRVPPVELPPGRHRAARRVAHRPRPHARLPARAGAPHRRRRARGARRARRHRLAQDLRRRGLHVYVRIAPEHSFGDVRRAALAFAREVERRAPTEVTTTWWRKDRDPAALFVDYNQNARDHTMAAAYSVRGGPTPAVSTPITWDEIDDVEAEDFTIRTVPPRFAALGDLHADIDAHPWSIDPLLEWADRDEREGAVDPGHDDDADERRDRSPQAQERVDLRPSGAVCSHPLPSTAPDTLPTTTAEISPKFPTSVARDSSGR